MVENSVIFKNDALGVELPTKICNGIQLFPVYNICKMLGYKNTTKTVADNLFPEYLFKFRNVLGKNKQPILLTNEAGVYQLVLRCSFQAAKPFQKWVVEEVLPSIHKNGGYIMGQEKLSEDERNKLLSRIHSLEQEVSNARKALGMTGESKKREAMELRTLSMQFRARADELDEEGNNILSNMNEIPNASSIF